MAAAYPVEFLNIPGMNIIFGLCLVVESTGIAHAVWLLCYAIKNAFYSCLCKYHQLQVDRYRTKGGMKKTEEYIHVLEDVELSKKRTRNKKTGEQSLSVNASDVLYQIKVMIKQIEDQPDILNIVGDTEYPKPHEFAQKFKEKNLSVPCFLTDPHSKDHIPPHIVAMALLKHVTTDQYSKFHTNFV